jgi:predicted transcriptional regulator of viral defense system
MEKDSLTPEQRAGALAAQQHAAITRSQAIKAGLTRHDIDGRVARGQWLAPIRGIYVVAGAPSTWQQQLTVAMLAAPPGSVASYLSAAALFALADPPDVPHITVPRGLSGRIGDCVVHWARLDSADMCVIGRFPCTRPARTVVDCAGLLGYEALCEMVDRALCRRRVASRAVMRSAARRASPGSRRRGLPALERALEVWTPGPRPGSEAEMRLIRQLVEWGFPMPERQIKVFDHDGHLVAKVDCGWRALRVGLEYEGAEYHGPRRWGADDRREDRIEALGWRIEPVDKFDLRPSATRLRDLLAPLFAAGREAA